MTCSGVPTCTFGSTPLSSYLLIRTSDRYISRANPRDNTHHVILSTTSVKPADFAIQLNMSLANGWGIVRMVTDLCMKLPDGKYVLVKDPNKVHDFEELS